VKEHLARVVSSAPHSAANAMREYLQARILQLMQDRGAWRHLAFMGGTALRFLYLMPRFSEDLDFTLERGAGSFDLASLLGDVKAGLRREAYAVEVKASTGAVVQKAFVQFPGLQYELGLTPHQDQVFSVKIEVDTRPPLGAVLATTTVRRFVVLRLVHHDQATLLGGKVAALLLREWVKGRDVYDLVWYLSDPTWPEPNETLLESAFTQAGRDDLIGAWKPALVERVRTAGWEHVESDVLPFLERPEDRWLVERSSVLGVLEKRSWR